MAGKIAIVVLVAGVLAATGFAVFGGNDDSGAKSYTTVASVKPDLTDADPRLKAIYAQAGDLIPNTNNAFAARISSLYGIPVVANKWGSWCEPCRREFPAFQGAAKSTGDQVAFLGVNVNDSVKAANGFLEKFPVPYPSYIDDKLKISKDLKPRGFAPITGFYNTGGVLVHIHAGPYDTAAQLENDIKKYIPADSRE